MRNLFGAARPPAAEQAEILPRGLHFSIFGVEAAPGAEAAVASRLGPRRYVSFQSRGPMGSPRPVVTIYGRCPAKLAAVCRYRPPRALPDGSVSLKRSDPRYGRGPSSARAIWNASIDWPPRGGDSSCRQKSRAGCPPYGRAAG